MSTSSSYSDSSTSPSPTMLSPSWHPTGVYVPVHKRRSGHSSASSSTSSSPSSAHAALPSLSAPAPFVYSRADLLALATSPLVPHDSESPAHHALVEAFPRIIRAHGKEIQRALDMAGVSPSAKSRPSRHARTSPSNHQHIHQSQHGSNHYNFRRERDTSSEGSYSDSEHSWRGL